MRTFEYRLYPNKEQSKLLMQCLIESRYLYNEMLSTVKQQYEEKLTIDPLVKNHHLAKSIMDASWGAFLDILEAKAANAGHQVIRVNPRFTTQRCNHCGALVRKSLSVRTHICTSCGYVADRDVNAAKNILLRARAWPSGTVSDGSPVELRSSRL